MKSNFVDKNGGLSNETVKEFTQSDAVFHCARFFPLESIDAYVAYRSAGFP
jgi:hypothetical protein